ncbi:Copper/zinc superoxide dismutase (SODC) [Chaetoceros tenuissimus]|uniref:Copper/zinc superoxide dismutase (SODC) n=1 Tax=Chaetoceros tenuissimus TaxID=426638 RepID=A0AAD3HDW2_9STRA|nr:Copper/zinc superoxide dismutase (SODC) [Chaetoceros tenuissimus]
MSVLTKLVILFYLCQSVVGDFCLKAKLGRYTSEDYDKVDEDLAKTIDGHVDVSFADLDTTEMTFKYNIYGGAKGCNKCGIHIHEGTTCMYHQIVKGHYWYPGRDGKVEDPWTEKYGAVYSTNPSIGDAYGSFKIDAGLNYMANLRHAVVLHDDNGDRYGCGILEFVECPAHTQNTQNTQNTQKKQKKAKKKKNKANKAKGRRRKL